MRKLIILLLLLLCRNGIYAQKTYIYCGKLIDCVSGSVKPEMTVIIEGNKISGVEKGFVVKASEADRIVDLKNRTVMPGLMDMHVHLEDEMNRGAYLERFTQNLSDKAFRSVVFAERTLMQGFTTVRDLGGSGVNVSLRNAINSGMIKGPRVYRRQADIWILPTDAGRTSWEIPGPPKEWLTGRTSAGKPSGSR
jgi:imidazolonepropionase-like amidohydrolase